MLGKCLPLELIVKNLPFIILTNHTESLYTCKIQLSAYFVKKSTNYFWSPMRLDFDSKNDPNLWEEFDPEKDRIVV